MTEKQHNEYKPYLKLFKNMKPLTEGEQAAFATKAWEAYEKTNTLSKEDVYIPLLSKTSLETNFILPLNYYGSQN